MHRLMMTAREIFGPLVKKEAHRLPGDLRMRCSAEHPASKPVHAPEREADHQQYSTLRFGIMHGSDRFRGRSEDERLTIPGRRRRASSEGGDQPLPIGEARHDHRIVEVTSRRLTPIVVGGQIN